MSGRVLVVNCGSSSLKCRGVDVGSGTALASGLAERIGQPSGRLTHSRPGSGEDVVECPLPDHGTALSAVLAAFDSSAGRAWPTSA